MLLQPLPTSKPGSQLPQNKNRLHPSEAAAVCSLEGVRNLDGGTQSIHTLGWRPLYHPPDWEHSPQVAPRKQASFWHHLRPFSGGRGAPSRLGEQASLCTQPVIGP